MCVFPLSTLTNSLVLHTLGGVSGVLLLTESHQSLYTLYAERTTGHEMYDTYSVTPHKGHP